jgi:hypothetical protein
MAAGKVALGAALGALVALGPRLDASSHDADVSGGAPSALVLRASANLSVHEGHGDASLRAHASGRTWRLALAWSSERGRVQVGAVIANQPDS